MRFQLQVQRAAVAPLKQSGALCRVAEEQLPFVLSAVESLPWCFLALLVVVRYRVQSVHKQVMFFKKLVPAITQAGEVKE